MRDTGALVWQSLPDRLRVQGERTPMAVAIAGEAGQLRYAEVAATVERRATLIAERLGHGSRVHRDSVPPTDVPIVPAELARVRPDGPLMLGG